MKYFSITFTLLFLSTSLKAQNMLMYAGARSQAMSDASVTMSDVFAAFNNQAALTGLSNTEAGIAVNTRFAVKEMNTLFAAFALPLSENRGVFSVSLNRYGYSLFNQSKAGIGYARKLSQVFSAGIQLDYMNTHLADGYGSRSSFTVEAGVLATFNKLKAGVHFFNPVNVKLADYDDERIPIIVKAGISYEVSEKVIAAAEMYKNINDKSIFKVGIEYHPVKALYVRGGVSSSPVQFTFGVGAAFGNFHFDISSGYMQPLGYSPAGSLRYSF
jgi:hypothetical protein